MRSVTSRHRQSLRCRPYGFWDQHLLHSNTFRPVLNVRQFIVFLKAQGFIPDEGGEAKGKKRASSFSLEGASAKRLKTSTSTISSSHGADIVSVSTNEVEEDGNEYSSRYPVIDPANDVSGHSLSPDIQHVPVYQHSLEMQYTNDVPDRNEKRFANDRTAHSFGWIQEEDELVRIIKHLVGDASEPQTIDLGTLPLRYHHGHFVAIFEELEKDNQRPQTPGIDFPKECQKWFFLLPHLAWEDDADLDALDYSTSPSHRDILYALWELRILGRVTMDIKLNLVIYPSSAYDASKHEMPFCFHVELIASLVVPTIFEPITAHTQREILHFQDVQRRFLSFVFPQHHPVPSFDSRDINIPYFYSILGPAPRLGSQELEETVQHEDLLPVLLPFQRRSIAWMLGREGKEINNNGIISPAAGIEEGESAKLPLFWDRVETGDITFYLHRLTGVVSPTVPIGGDSVGGILAEEPGLGKTLECIALILLNPSTSRNPSVSSWDAVAQLQLKEVKTTLIVTPTSLASQWVDELAIHAPTLKVLVYDGWSKLRVPTTQGDTATPRTGKRKYRAKVSSQSHPQKRRKKILGHNDDFMDVDEEVADRDDTLDWCSYLNGFDVCITTYNILQQDLAVARAPPVRPRREVASYSKVARPRSPLVVCEWYRVIMDEVQMQGGGKTEEMVGLIPRVFSFAVSGTPARAQVSDLVHVLKFLRVDWAAGRHPFLWKRLLKPGFAAQFAQLFRHYAIRTMKSVVKDELTIPQQTRYLVSIQLGPVERHVYDQNMESALLELGLDARGVAASEGWQVDAGLLRTILRQLRGICTHPQVGNLQQKGDKLYKTGALKTMADVLEAMRDQNWRNLMDDRKSKVQALVRFSQLQQHDDDDPNRHQHALSTLLQAEKEANQLISDIRNAIAEHEKKGEFLKAETMALKETLERSEDPPAPERLSSSKGKEKATERDRSVSIADSEDQDLPKTPVGEAHASKRRALQLRLRECYVALHKVKFLQGDAYHVLGESHSVAEDKAYGAAEDIRRDLLKITEQSASRAMAELSRDAAAKGLTADVLLIQVPYCNKGGIRSSNLMDEANEMIETLLNKQSKLLWQWRSRIYELLTQNLSTGSGEADGQEYSRTLETQGEAETYLQVYVSLLADRREVLVAERTLLATHDAREKKYRKTKAATAAAVSEAAAEAELEIPEDIEMQPEHEVLHKHLSETRKELLRQFSGRAIKSVMIDLSNVATRIFNDDDPERIIAKEGVTRLRRLINSQNSLMDKLDADVARFRKAFNERILYFRQLQEISDSVAEVAWESTVAVAMQICRIEQNELDTNINTNKARQRYLDHLAKNKEEERDHEEQDECCILCRCEFTRGFITQCAHVFCESCMKAWLLRKEGKACPVCRAIINVDQMQRFTVHDKDKDPALPAKLINDEPAPKSSRQIHYNMIDGKLFKEIETVESRGSYGSKIQTLVRHLLYLQIIEPGSKSIIFSAWADSLHIVQRALIHNGIPSLRIDQNSKENNAGKKFRTDDKILVLLLHGERENAGLNVTCASRVFLLESVVHHGFEIQAIARIDRMGQRRPTEVYCYYAEDTIERNILDLAAKQGLSLYTKENSAGTLNVANLETTISSPARKQKAQKGDFIFKTDDMLAILFPHMFEDTEYLLPQDSGTIEEHDHDGTVNETPPNHRYSESMTTIAGPSRLR